MYIDVHAMFCKFSFPNIGFKNCDKLRGFKGHQTKKKHEENTFGHPFFSICPNCFVCTKAFIEFWPSSLLPFLTGLGERLLDF